MHHTKSKYLALALCLAIFPTSMMAAGLGKLNVVSGLGEPLKADIELLSITAEELASITAAIASNQAYSEQGLEKPASHNDIKIQVSKNARGAPILKLNSTQPITDAFLDMLIQVDWSSGRLLREYTLLLDPPGYVADTSSSTNTVQVPATAKSVTITTTPDAPKAVKRVEPKSTNEVKVQSASDTSAELPAMDMGEQTHESMRGDTLAKIANDMKPEGVSLEQMLVGLFQANPKAFDGNNMNRLKVGQILRAPDVATLQSISNKTANKEIRVQAANWNAYKNQLAGLVADSAPREEAMPTQSSSGKVMTAEDQAAPANTGPKDVVKLSGAENAASAANQKALQDKVIALQEELIAKENALRDTQSKTADLQKQIADMKALMDLKNDTMARMQNDAGAPATSPAPAPMEQAPVAEAPLQQVAPVNPQVNDAVLMPTPVKPVVNKPATNTAPAPVTQSSFLSEMMTNLDVKTLGLAGAALAVLIGGWLYLRNKRRKNLASFEEGIMTSGGLKANTVFGNTAGGTVDTGDTSFLTDFSQSPTGSMIDSHDVDPIAEAEVYMAYGRDAQAEEILKDAMVKEPKRYELHLKLLEIYQLNVNTSAFEAISGELYTTLGPNDPIWEKVSQLGVKMDPDNPLYRIVAAESAHAAALDEAIFTPAVATDVNSPASATSDSFDSTLTFSEVDASGEQMTDTIGQPDALDAYLAASDNDLLGQSDTPVAATAKTEESFDFNMDGLDFNLDTAEDADKPTTFETLPAFEEISSTTDLDKTGLDINSAEAAKVDEPTSYQQIPSFDLGDLNMDSVAETPTDDAPPMSLDSPTIHFGEDTLLDSPDSTQPANEDVTFNIAEPVTKADDLVFDIAENADLGMAAPSNFDFTDIDLDLGDSSADSYTEEIVMGGVESIGNGLPGSEPEEVETKLDLVMAYLDMEDTIGARELLEEVMKEGGESQRKRAEDLLAKIA